LKGKLTQVRGDMGVIPLIAAAMLHVHFSRADVVMARALAGSGMSANEGAGFAEPREWRANEREAVMR
jgi:hypothetical protein